jgi:thiol:disulfide interchange protein DsbC
MIKLFLALLISLSFSYAHADAAKVKDLLQKNYPQLGPIDKTYKTNILGLYEVVAQGMLFYTDKNAQYLINGNIIDLKTMRNLTEERSQKLFAIDFNSLPFDLAIKKVKGNGQRKMAYFSDPNCGFCQKLEGELKNVDNVTLYLFMLSIFQGSDKKVQGVWCSKDRVKAWDNLMQNHIQPPAGTCDTPTAKLMELSQKLSINGTPALIFSDGTLIPGYRPAAELEKALNNASSR